MCMTFGYNTQVNFVSFFHSLTKSFVGSTTTEAYGH